MPNPNIQLFEEAVAALQRTVATGHHRNGIPTEQFADVMFQVADEVGSVTCEIADENRLCFFIDNDEPRFYEFPARRILRSVLSGIAQVVWEHNPQTPESLAFNPYGDKQEVIYTNSNGIANYFQVETANTNSKPLFFTVHKSSTP